MEDKEEQSAKRKKQKQKQGQFWTWVTASVLFRLILIYFPQNLNLSSRPEVSTPLTSLRRRTVSLSLLSLAENLTFTIQLLNFFTLIFLFQWPRDTGWSSHLCLPMQVSYCVFSLFLKFMLHFLNSNLTHLFMFLSAGFCRIYVPWISFVALTSWTTHSQTVFQLKLFPFSNSCSHWRFFYNVI